MSGSPVDSQYLSDCGFKHSERLRIKSAKGNKPFAHHGEEFVYDLDQDDMSVTGEVNVEGNEGESESDISAAVFRPRSSSWSSVGAAVVERRISRKIDKNKEKPKSTKKKATCASQAE